MIQVIQNSQISQVSQDMFGLQRNASHEEDAKLWVIVLVMRSLLSV